MKITRALSIRQPYAEEILTGKKVVEYRTIPTNIRERIYIYASQKFDTFRYGCYEDEMKHKIEKLPKGVIVGTVEIVGCDDMHDEAGEYYWRLANPKRLKRPLKPKNKPQPVWFKPF